MTLAWPAGWAYVGLYAGLAAIGAVVLLPHHTELVVERSRGAAGGKRWDFWVTRLLLVATLAILGTAGLDHRWGLTPELAVLAGTLSATGIGIVTGWLAVRRQGIYFAMVTLALAQMVYFICVQAPFTYAEDGIQSVPATST